MPQSSTDPRKKQDLLPRDGETFRGRTWYKKGESTSFRVMQKRTCPTESHLFECHGEACRWVQWHLPEDGVVSRSLEDGFDTEG